MPPEAPAKETAAASSSATISVKLPFEVVTGQIPKDMLERLRRDFSESEIEQIHARCGRTLAPRIMLPDRPSVLFVLGPSAVGKSYITDASASQLFGNAHNAVILDGEFFREWHAGWCDVVLHGMKQHVLHQDAWTIFKDVKVEPEKKDGAQDGGGGGPLGISTALKQKILLGAIRDRQNLIVPSCANQPERLEQEMSTLQKAGYNMHAVCLWAPVSETRQRGEPRSVREGKRWDGSSYRTSTKTVLEVARRWTSDLEKHGADSIYSTIYLWDNTIFPAREVDIGEFALLSNMSDEEADEHAWKCKRPKAGAAWGKLRTAHVLQHMLKRGHNDAPTQTDITINPSAKMMAGSDMLGAGTSASSLRRHRIKGRKEGAIAAALGCTLLWGAVCIALAVLLVQQS